MLSGTPLHHGQVDTLQGEEAISAHTARRGGAKSTAAVRQEVRAPRRLAGGRGRCVPLQHGRLLLCNSIAFPCPRAAMWPARCACDAQAARSITAQAKKKRMALFTCPVSAARARAHVHHTRARARARTRAGARQSISTLIFRAPRRTPCAVDPKDSEPARFNFNPCLQPDKIAIRDMIVPANSVRAKQLRVSVKPGTEGAPHHLLICTRAATHGECERRGWFIQSTLLSVAVAHADQAAPEERTAPLCRNGGSTNAHGASDRDGDAHRRQASAEN